MSFPPPGNLNQALWRLLLAVVLPLLLGALALLLLQRHQENRLALTRLAALGQTLVQAVDAEFDRGLAQLEVLAASPAIDAGDWRQMRDFAASVAARQPGSVVAMVGPDGQVLFNTAVPWGTELPNLWALGAQNKEVLWEGRRLPLSSGNLSRQAFLSGKPSYSDLYLGVNTHRPALSVAVPVRRDGQSRYALIMSYPPALLQERISAAVQLPEIRAMLLDRRGVVVASNEASVPRLADHPAAAPVAAGAASGFYDAIARDGVEFSGAFAVSPVNGFVVRVALPHDALPTRLTSLAWAALLLSAIAVSTVLASLLSRRIARPLRELGDDVLAGRSPPADRRSGIVEIDLLAQALRDGALAEHQRAEAEVLRTVAQNQEALLRQADRHKDEFLATLAHELRNPLAPIRNSVELIRLRAPQDPMIERARATIERQTMHLSHLVDDLLEVSRITLGRIQLRQEPVDIGDVAASAAESILATATKLGLVVQQEIARPSPFVLGDPTRLAQCVVNVLNNSVKFTPRGGRVTVRVGEKQGVAVVEVQDTGVGVSPENLEHIFGLFVQERHSGHGGNSGLGIGLALTRRLVELHGGRIRAESQGLGNGTTFRIELPVVEAPAVAAPAQEPAPAASPGNARVLVVDDNRDAAESLGELLSMGGYSVSLAHDGESAVRTAQEQDPEVVLLDIGLPDIDGYEVCRRIRARDGDRPVVIAVTGWGQQSDQDAARSAGFDGHMTKPVALEQLMAMLGARLLKA